MTFNQTTSLGIPSGLFLGALLLGGGALSIDPSSVRLPQLSSPRKVAAAANVSAETVTSTDETETDRVLGQKVALLMKGRNFLDSVESYTAEFRKREVVGGELLDEQLIQLKCRHQPFSVYLHWLTSDVGREVLYVEGSNDGRLLAHDGGWKARLPAFSLSPDSSLAMRDTRYPVTVAGVKGLLDLMLEIHNEDLRFHRAKTCEVQQDIKLNGRPCRLFITHYASPDISPTYRKSITWIDEEWCVPVKSLHYEWLRSDAEPVSDLGEATLIESYEFSKLDFANPLTDGDFDRDHPSYRFR